jgi:hypothetical protein
MSLSEYEKSHADEVYRAAMHVLQMRLDGVTEEACAQHFFDAWEREVVPRTRRPEPPPKPENVRAAERRVHVRVPAIVCREDLGDACRDVQFYEDRETHEVRMLTMRDVCAWGLLVAWELGEPQ